MGADTTDSLALLRQERLRAVMRRIGTAAILTADPITITYATGAQNMTIFGMMGPSRFLLLFADGPAILFEFAGCDHLAAGLATIDEIRSAPGTTALAGYRYQLAVNAFADEIAEACLQHAGIGERLGVHRIELVLSDALRASGVTLVDAGPVFNEARRVKLDAEVVVMREAVRRAEAAAAHMALGIEPGPDRD